MCAPRGWACLSTSPPQLHWIRGAYFMVGTQVFPKWMDVWMNELVLFPSGMPFLFNVSCLNILSPVEMLPILLEPSQTPTLCLHLFELEWNFSLYFWRLVSLSVLVNRAGVGQHKLGIPVTVQTGTEEGNKTFYFLHARHVTGFMSPHHYLWGCWYFRD